MGLAVGEDGAVHTVYSDRHRAQAGRVELIDGQLLPCFERPERADIVLDAVRGAAFGPVIEPTRHGREPLERVHTPAFVDFLEHAWEEWTVEHGDIDGLPLCWPTRAFGDRVPDAIDGKLSYYSFDAGTPITAGTWDAASAAADVALTGVDLLIGGDAAAFSLCRPPGHHATADSYGGYCFLNNAAIAAQALRDGGVERVAVLDVDYHHGNGTQAIFETRSDVVFASLHGDPRQEYPYFLGYEDEHGRGDGLGATRNFPLPWGTGFDAWSGALDEACRWIGGHGVGAVVVSLGVDTYEGDPISRFRLATTDFPEVGRRIAGLGRPTLFVFEGGYATDALGPNVRGVLEGFTG
jgi:acetoin utilization deacetylase AcuC-like enzyme